MPEEMSEASGEALGKLVEVFPDVISQMPGLEFTSHQFILTLARLHQRLYVEALHRYADKDAPFNRLHVLISQRLARPEYNLERLVDADSEDIFRQPGRCAAWRKKA